MKFNPVKEKKIYEKIIDQIRDMIYQGKLKKGDKLPSERKLTKSLNVSRASLREAFSALEMLGLIESRHGEGTFIKEDTGDNFLKPLSLLFMLEDSMEQELVELRKIIEIRGVKYAVYRASDSDLIELEKYIELMKKNRENEKISRQADRKFHYTLSKATGNNLVCKFLNSISGVMGVYFVNIMKKISRDEDKSNKCIRQHTKIYEAIVQRDEKLAQKVMEEHLDWAESLLDL
ncbi:FadR/GntR family transcriptional regulator [Halanaerobaculum tunisiense]